MAVVVRISANGTPEQYHEINRRLDAAGQYPPPGLLFHAATEGDGTIEVTDVWNSAEEFQTFGQILLPIFADLGVEVNGQPELTDTIGYLKGA